MAHITDLGFTLLELGKAIDDGDVRAQTHPEFPELAIHNYSEEVQFRNKWNKITLACRGLAINTVTGEIVARPWEKFFNFGQRDLEIEFNAPVEVTDKMDGSLGILYKNPGIHESWAIATRGSFASDQAVHATKVFNERYRYDMIENEDYTFLFEIIYPDNRIVCNYGDTDDLVLLGAVQKEYGWYIGPREAANILSYMGPVTEVFNYRTFAEAISAPDRKGAEGYVIRSGNKIVKLKQADYVELHRIVTNLSPKTIWQMLGDGRTVADICNDIPDEFHGYVKDIGDDLLRQASEIAFAVKEAYLGCLVDMGCDYGDTPLRKKFALQATKTPYAKYLFLMLDGKDIAPVVWHNIKPRGDVKTLVKDEG